LPALFSVALAVASSGCGILIGSARPVDEKDQYGIMDLAKDAPDVWVQLDPQSSRQEDFELGPSEVADVAYQSKRTAAIISLNSACRPGQDYRDKSLKQLTDELLLGIQASENGRLEAETKVSGAPALETTLTGTVNRQATRVRTVVLKRGSCVYDLMFVARPRRFAEDEPTFNRFVESLRVRGAGSS
jgi:hypothetical protein